MRVLWATTVLIVVALAGYASSGASAQAEFTQAGLVSGEKVRLSFDLDRSPIDCLVTQVRGDFVGCKAQVEVFRAGQPSYDGWYNLRLITRIERPAKP